MFDCLNGHSGSALEQICSENLFSSESIEQALIGIGSKLIFISSRGPSVPCETEMHKLDVEMLSLGNLHTTIIIEIIDRIEK